MTRFPIFSALESRPARTPGRHFDQLGELTLTFRCVQEKYVTRGLNRDDGTQVVCYELYKGVATFTRDQLTGAASSYLPLAFAVPANHPATRLSDTPPTIGKSKGVAKLIF